MESPQRKPLAEGGTPRPRVRGRYRDRAAVELLHSSSALVDESGQMMTMKDADELAFFAMADPVHRARKPVTEPQKYAPTQIPADAAFNAVFDSSGEALVLIDSAGVIQRANRRARELLRLKEADARRQGLRDLLANSPTEQLALWCSQETPPGAQPLESSLLSGVQVRITLRSILPVSRYLLLCLEEGSIVQRAEAKWRLVDAELRSVLDSVQIGIILFDPSGRLRFSSVRFGEIFGLDARKLEKIGSVEELEELIAPRVRNPESFAAPWNAVLRGVGEPGHDELEIRRPARRVIERFWRPVLDVEGRAVGWLELYSDVTGERQIQSKMLQTEKMAALGQLVSGIAHELNNPLTSIMGYAQLLLGHGLAPEQLSEARKVYHEAERARRIVKHLLYFARENKPERTRVDLNEIVERTLALRSYELKVENIIVECALAPGLPQTMADPYQLQQVVLNLVVNAEQALLEGRGQGHVWIRTKHVIQGVGSQVEHRILLEVSDDGPGIPPEIASRVFDPFFTSKPFGVGTGLGLSIVYGIVHQHGGEVTFESQPGAGTKFVVGLPVVAAPAQDLAAALPSLIGKTETAVTGRVLVVEDEPTIAQLIVDVLREEGDQVEAVLDSQEGLTRLSRGRFDLVICDLRMPRLDGPAFYEALVRAGSPVRNRVLFITGDVLAPRTIKFLESHGLPYLVKPFLVEELKLAVNRLLASGARDDRGAKRAVASGGPGTRSTT
jgi:signal transduction histidine kinase/CheY-like chemotaxis protein